MIYALIEKDIVTNIIALQDKNASDFINAVPIKDMAVCIGDNYSEGVFYHEGNPIKSFIELRHEASYNEGYDQAVLDLMEV